MIAIQARPDDEAYTTRLEGGTACRFQRTSRLRWVWVVLESPPGEKYWERASGSVVDDFGSLQVVSHIHV